MKSKKRTPAKPSKQDKAWHAKIEKNVSNEKVVLDNPQGKEHFDQTLKNAHKKK
jgi:hypothetical protein